MNIKNTSIQFVLAATLMSLALPSFARTDGGGKKNASQYHNPNSSNSRGNYYYCWKDLSLNYTPSRHKYAKKS